MHSMILENNTLKSQPTKKKPADSQTIPEKMQQRCEPKCNITGILR